MRLSEFHAKIDIDTSIVEQLALRTANLQLLTIRDMNRTSEQVREALVLMTVKIFRGENELATPLTNLWLSRLGSAEEGDQLLNALSDSKMTTVRYLNFGDNKSWWSNPNAIGILANFIKKQEHLEELKLHKNNLTGAMLTKLLFTLRTSKSIQSLKKVQLDECMWDTDEACEELAQILAEAPRLESVRIFNQKGSRKIDIELQSAPRPTSGRQSFSRNRGFVRIFDFITGVNICLVNTWRSEEINIGK